MQHDLFSPSDPSFLNEPKPDAAKRFAAGVHIELGLAANGKALRHDRLDPWSADEAVPNGSSPWH